MRWIKVLSLIVAPLFVNAQVKKVWIGDTLQVESWSNFSGDTTYHLRTPDATEWELYYDIALTEKAVHNSSVPRFDSCWYRNGQVKGAWYPQPYCSNCPSSKGWYPNGQLEFSLTCNEDSCVFLAYYASGQLRRKSVDRIIDSIRQLPFYEIEYFENGQAVHSMIDYTSPKRSTVKYYYPSGKQREESQLINGYNYGKCTHWYESGQVMITGQYKKKRNYSSKQQAIRTGTWRYYNESGQLVREEHYKRGKLIKEKSYLGGFPMG